MSARYAIYYAPDPSSPLWRFGAGVLGYDASTGGETPFHPGPPFDDPRWPAQTEEPRRYGFHATLKAPFRLRAGAREEDLLRAATGFARGCRRVPVTALAVATLGSFLALVPTDPNPALDELAADCVRAFDPFRAPLTMAERTRRLAAPLTERQVRNLDEWGYPFVFEDFRFHLTLSGRLPTPQLEPARAALEGRYLDLPAGLDVDAVTVFRQDDPASRFAIVARCLLCG